MGNNLFENNYKNFFMKYKKKKKDFGIIIFYYLELIF